VRPNVSAIHPFSGSRPQVCGTIQDPRTVPTQWSHGVSTPASCAPSRRCWGCVHPGIYLIETLDTHEHFSSKHLRLVSGEQEARCEMDDTSPLLPDDPPPATALPKAIITTHRLDLWKSRTNERLHLEAQRRSLDFYIGEYLHLRRELWSEYGTSRGCGLLASKTRLKS
jgi:hypothetical protein